MTSRELTIAEKFRAKFDAFIQEHKNDKLSKEDEELLRDPARRRFIKHVTELEFAKRGISLHPTQPTTKTLFLLNKFFNIKGDDHYSKPEWVNDEEFFGDDAYEDEPEPDEETCTLVRSGSQNEPIASLCTPKFPDLPILLPLSQSKGFAVERSHLSIILQATACNALCLYRSPKSMVSGFS